MKRSLVALTALVLTMGGTAEGREFPDSWYYKANDKQKAKQAAIEGKKMPLLDLSDWYKDSVKVSDLKGKIVVVDIWATWCGPCLRAIPHNVKLYSKYKKKGLVVIGVCSSSGQEKMKAICKKYKVNYPSARDKNKKTAKAWNLQWYPTYAVVDRKGIVRAIGLHASGVEKAVKKLMDEKASE